MFEDDGFFIDDDELGEDNQLSIVDDAVVKSLDALIKAANAMKENIKFNEQLDASNNLRILSMHLDSIIKLSSIDSENLSDEEVFEIIENILKQTTELTFANINSVLKTEDDSATTVVPSDSNPNDSDFDF